jgi:hypothetical protein
MMIGYDIYDRFTMDHQGMILTTIFFLLATVLSRPKYFGSQCDINDIQL